MAFQEVQLPVNVSQGARDGPRRKTQIVALANGDEERDASWLNSHREFDLVFAVRNAEPRLPFAHRHTRACRFRSVSGREVCQGARGRLDHMLDPAASGQCWAGPHGIRRKAGAQRSGPG